MAQRVTLAIPDPNNPGQDINVGTASNPFVTNGGGGTQTTPSIAGGEYSSALPALTNGQTDALQLTSGGALVAAVSGMPFSGIDALSNANLIYPVSGGTGGNQTTQRTGLVVAPSVFNGSTWDRQRGDTVSMYSRNAPRTKNSSALVAASTTSQQAFAANTLRTRLLIQNQDAAINIFVNLGAAATAGGGSLRIGPGGSLDLTGTSETVNIIAQSGTPAITAWEF